MKDPKQFRERFKKWKEGTPIEEIYDNGRPTYFESVELLASPMAKNWTNIKGEFKPSAKYVGNTYSDGKDLDKKNSNPYTVEAIINALYASNPREEFLGEPSHHYDFTQSEEWANAHGYYPDARGHRDDRVKKIAHPSHPSRGVWNKDLFKLTDFGIKNPNYTLFGLNDGGLDPLAVLTYKGGIVLPEITITPKENYIFNPYDNIILHNKYSGGKDDRTYIGGSNQELVVTPGKSWTNPYTGEYTRATESYAQPIASKDPYVDYQFYSPTGNSIVQTINSTPKWQQYWADQEGSRVNNAIGKAAPIVLDLLTAVDGVAGGVDLLEGIYNLGKWANNVITTSQWIPMLYVRYSLGKGYNWLHGRNVELPTIYRRVKALPLIEGNKVVFTNPDSRFAFINGEPSPNITNMTTDMGVLAHASGDWDEALTLATSGRQLLGKNVVSTKPMDTFTYGDVIKVPKNKVSLISGDPLELLFAQQNGLNAITTDDLLLAYNDVIKGTKSIKQGRFSLVKLNWSPYAKKSNEVLRSRFKSPTVDDYKFMDYVFNPKYRSEVYPIEEDLFNLAINDAKFGEIFGNSNNRGYLEDKSRWGNVIYDPSPPIEAQFRKDKGIDLRKYIPVNTPNRYLGYVPDYDWANGIDFSYARGKDSSIYIKPSKRGTFTAAAKKRGMSVLSFASKVLNNPSNYSKAMRKKALFAKNASKFKH